MPTKQFLQTYPPLGPGRGLSLGHPDEGRDQAEQESRVLTASVAAVLRRLVRPDDDDLGSSVSLVADKAKTSTRTVYRVLSESTETISLDLADRLCLASDSHLAATTLLLPDGTEKPYFDGDSGSILG